MLWKTKWMYIQRMVTRSHYLIYPISKFLLNNNILDCVLLNKFLVRSIYIINFIFNRQYLKLTKIVTTMTY